MRWIDPVASAATRLPSARTLAECRRFGPYSRSPGFRSPCSISQPKGMRGSSRLPGVAATASGEAGATAATRSRARAA